MQTLQESCKICILKKELKNIKISKYRIITITGAEIWDCKKLLISKKNVCCKNLARFVQDLHFVCLKLQAIPLVPLVPLVPLAPLFALTPDELIFLLNK